MASIELEASGSFLARGVERQPEDPKPLEAVPGVRRAGLNDVFLYFKGYFL